MTSGDLAEILSEQLTIPISKIDLYGRHLRAAGMLSIKGHGRGAAEMTPVDAATWLISLCIDHERGGDFIRETRRVFSLPLCEQIAVPDNLGDGLAFPKARSAGEAIAALIVDTRSLRFADEMAKRQDIFTAAFDAAGIFAAISISNKKIGSEFQAGEWTFQRGQVADRKRRNLERVTVVHGAVLHDIAKAMEIAPH